MKTLFAIFFTIISLVVIAQKQYIFRIQIKNMPNAAAYLYNMYGDNTTLIDTAFANEDKKLIFNFTDTSHIGMYRCIFGDKKYLDIIFNKENIDIITTFNAPIDSINIVASVENRLLYNYFKNNRMFERKSEFLIPIIRFYPEKDSFYKIAEEEYNKLQLNRDKFLDETIINNPNRFVARYLKAKRNPFIDTKMSDIQKVIYVQEHFWDDFDFNDTLLMYCDAYSSKLINFLQLFKIENATKQVEEQQYIKGIDILMKHIKKEDASYNFFLDYMIRGFEKYEFNSVLEHIAANYQTTSACENEERKSKLQKTIDFYKKTAIGAIAPNIELKDINGKISSMKDINEDFIVVIFWQTNCPYCEEFIPKLNEYYNKDKNRNYEVYAVSIDTNVEKWKGVIKAKDYHWINVNESNGWDNKVMDDYNIYATPTILVLNKERKIVAKPLSLEELIDELEKVK